ncbi:MAG TPA: sigma-54 dependent transcriptional regulator [Pseudomonadota bacterium]|jgi:two-component system response regulator HydG|nr:sigma-54 dependent transcriptional regulator [Pseudomonadota bacterium]HNI61418.1 sigma-54 dependent transcriptional regulator [Pseudomonadota bacterium]HNK45810.1 sigma-54 dependent transcriptional regulator [Pseudomonadota bacterium]HNN53028.1 sigma-54 dependent transcriptional regulator [Pseudomonadota bacterium]HNO68472.1 sigma-54 dependent transcriptional regulator [Pseudomonadota bacterium]
MTLARILILDDQRAARRVLRQMLEGLDEAEFAEAGTVEQALSLCREQRFDAYLVDIHLSENRLERGGIEFIKQVRNIQAAPSVVVTASVEMQDLREAMKAGAVDYVLKDQLSPELILPILREIFEKRDLRERVQQLGQRLDQSFGLGAIVGTSAKIEHVRALVRRLADADATVLLRGESGTGKELVAQALHQCGKRASYPLVTVNCAAIAPALIESELFGHERGAFTTALSRRIGVLEEAGAGTVFLDEIAELTPDLQAKLLRVLEARRFTRVGGNEAISFRARVIAATHQDLEQRIREGKLRADLYYRLNVVTIDVPSLADRREDISVLCNHFVSQFGRPLRFTKEALSSLEQRPWPGNVRELRNAVERLALLCESDVVTETALLKVVPLRSSLPVDSDEVERLARQFLARDMAGENKLDFMERTMVRIAMEVAGHNQSRAARILGLERKALERRFKRHLQETSGEVRMPRSAHSAGDSDEHLP